MTKSKYSCETCKFFSQEDRIIYAGKRCRKCDTPIESTLKINLCHGDPVGQHITWASAEKGLCCHSAFKSDSDKLIKRLKTWAEKQIEEYKNAESYRDDTQFSAGEFSGIVENSENLLKKLKEYKKGGS